MAVHPRGGGGGGVVSSDGKVSFYHNWVDIKVHSSVKNKLSQHELFTFYVQKKFQYLWFSILRIEKSLRSFESFKKVPKNYDWVAERLAKSAYYIST